jgi:hypothetical protein
MAWTNFLLGRPGYEMQFDVPAEAMGIDYSDIKVLQTNLAGDLKKSIIKTDVPTIRMSSSFLTLAQRNQLASLRHNSDTFFSFRCRDDWQVYYEPATIIDTTHVQLANTSATKLSALLISLGFSSIITVQTPFYQILPIGGAGGTTFNPGAVTYADATRIITLTNALPGTTSPIYVSYVYTGWLVELNSIAPNNKGGWLDRSTYDIEMVGA